MRGAELRCSIQLQPRLAVLAPAGFLTVMVGGGWLLYGLERGGVLPAWLANALGIGLFFVALAVALVAAVGIKGRVEVTSRTLVVHKGLAGTVVLLREGASYRLTRWRSYVHFTRWLDAGPQLKMTSRGRTVTVACLDPESARHLPAGRSLMHNLPVAVIAPEDFKALLGALGIEQRPVG